MVRESTKYLIFIVVLLVVMGILFYVRYNTGERTSVGVDEIKFIPVDAEEDQNVIFYIINKKSPIEVYVASYDEYQKARDWGTFHNLTGQHYTIDSYDRQRIEYNTPGDGRYGIMVTSNESFDRAEFSYQIREPTVSDHIVYSAYGYFSIILLIVLICVLGYLYFNSKEQEELEEDDNDAQNDPVEEAIQDWSGLASKETSVDSRTVDSIEKGTSEASSQTSEDPRCPYCNSHLLWDLKDEKFFCKECMKSM